MVTDLNTSLKLFNQISLTQLNSQASFLNRIDKKYLLTEEEFKNILKDLEEEFYVLEIGGKSIFEYESIYMDTDSYDFYNKHERGEKNRTKVRTRKYVDSDIAFFEYKQKQKGVTRKFRYQFSDLEEHGKMTNESNKFFEGIYQSFYSEDPGKIFPSLVTRYKRITFCSKSNEERLTVDFDIRLEDLRKKGKEITLDNLVIVESKSMLKKGKSGMIMDDYNIKKAKSCSKYCLGLIYNSLVKNIDKFKPTISRIEKIRNSK